MADFACLVSIGHGLTLGSVTPGFHAGEIARVHDFLSRHKDISEIKLVVCEDHTDSAVLHAILSTAEKRPEYTPAKLAIVNGQASLAAAAQARLYSTNNYYSWIFGLLTVYDKPDAIAAVLSLPKKVELLLLSPLDEILAPLSILAAGAEYKLAASIGGSRLTLQAQGADTPSAMLAAVVKWFGV
jgi:hypothetical protein